MDLNKIFKSKKQKLIYVGLFIVMLCIFIYLGTINFKDDLTDAQKFYKEFPSISEDNLFVYATASEVLDSLDGTSIILFGSSQNNFTEEYAKIINEVASEEFISEDDTYYIEKILYYDFIEDRYNNNGNYELIVDALAPYLLTDDMNNTELYAPTLLIVKDGEVLYINEEVNFVYGDTTPSEYWTDLNIGLFKETLRTAIKDAMGI